MAINRSGQPKYIADLTAWNVQLNTPIKGPFSWTGNSNTAYTVKYFAALKKTVKWSSVISFLMYLLCVFLFINNAEAFSCRSLEERYKESDYVFIAKITEISKLKKVSKKEFYYAQKLKLKIQEIIKGKLNNTAIEAVNIVSLPGYIGHENLQKNTVYLLSAKQNLETFEIEISGCDFAIEDAPRLKNSIDEIRRISKGN